MEIEKTAVAESDSAKTGQESVSLTDAKDAKTDSSTVTDDKPAPFDKDPRWKSARIAEKKLTDLLKANDLEDADDLLDLVQRGKAVKGKLSDVNAIDDIIKKAAKLDSYEAYWAAQKKKQERENLDPKTRAEKAERELEQERERQRVERESKTQIEETKKAIFAYEKEVKSLIDDSEIPKEYHGVALELFGVGNPSNDVDITDRKAIKKLVADGIKKIDTFKQAVIAEYLKEKKGIVKTGQGSEAIGGDKPTKMTFKEARKALLDRMQTRNNGS